MTKNKIITFSPNSTHQRQFLESLVRNTPVTLLCSGRQAGKTFVGAAGIPLQVYVRHNTAMGKGWVLTPTVDQTKQAKTSFERILGWVQEGGAIKRYLSHENAYILENNYRVEFKTASEPNNLRGGVVDWIWIDEAAFIEEEAFDIVQPCVAASGGPIWMTTTPNGKNWLYDRIFKKDGDPDFKIIHARSIDNPAINAKIIERMAAGYSEEMRAQEFEAVFTHRTGLVYPMFTLKCIQDPPKGGGEIVCGIDPGANDPFAYLWVLKAGEQFWVADEYYSVERKTLAEHASWISKHTLNRVTARRWSDPGRAQDNLDLALTYGLENFKAKNDLKGGINAVAEALEKGNLFISNKCTSLIKEMYNYIYKDKGEVPEDKNNHALDALRYVIFSERHFSNNDVQILSPEGLMIEQGCNEVYLPDGTQIPGFTPMGGPTPNSRR